MVAIITITYLQSNGPRHLFFFFQNSYPNMSLQFLHKTFILRNCIQQIELDIDISEKQEQRPRPPSRGSVLGHTVQSGCILLPHFSCTDLESFSHFRFQMVEADRGRWPWEPPGTFPPFSHRALYLDEVSQSKRFGYAIH